MTLIAHEKTPFTPIFSEYDITPSAGRKSVPMAQLFFPDAQSAVRFINAGMDEQYGVPLSVADFRSFAEGAYIGKQSEFNARVYFDSRSSTVVLTIENPISHTPEAHDRLHSFVMETIGVVIGDEEQAGA